MIRAAIRANAERMDTTATGTGVLLLAAPMTKPSIAMAKQATAGTLVKLSAIKA